MQHRKWSLASAGGERLSPGSGTSPAVAAELRTARQRLGWSIEEVAAALRIRAPYLQALEDGRLRDVPGSAYAVAFTRSYARCLGLDADETVRRLRAEMAELNRQPVLDFPMPVPERGVPAGAMVLLGVILAAFAYGGWYYVSGNQPPPPEKVATVPERLEPLAGDQAALPATPSPQIAAIQPETPPSLPPASAYVPPSVAPSQAAAMPLPAPLFVPPPATPATPSLATPALAAPSLATPSLTTPGTAALPAAPAAERLLLRARADTWLLVRDKAGQVLLNRVLHPGETWTPPADHAGLSLTTGNAGGLEMVVDGTPLPPLGGPGVVRRDLPLDPEALKTLPAALPASTGRAVVQ